MYTSGGAATGGRNGADFADFLLGLPQQATLQVGGTSAASACLQCCTSRTTGRRTRKLTLNLGLRYELAVPYIEADGRMANLDVTPDLHSGRAGDARRDRSVHRSVPVGSRSTTTSNNIGPRLGLGVPLSPRHSAARRLQHHLQHGSYASIARQLSGQPPFADTQTITDTVRGPLTLAEALLASHLGDDQQLGRRSRLRARHDPDVERDRHAQRQRASGPSGRLHRQRRARTSTSCARRIAARSGCRSTRAAVHLGIVWRPLDADAGDVPDSAAAGQRLSRRRHLHARQVHGQRLVARRGRRGRRAERQGPRGGVGDSRASIAGISLRRTPTVELPFGAEPSLAQRMAARWPALFGDWSVQLNVTLQSGTPFTARVLGASDRRRSAAPADRCAPTTSARRFRLEQSDDRSSSSTPAPSRCRRAGMFGNSPRNIDHRSGRPPAERAVQTRRAPRRQSRDRRSGQRDQPAQHRAVGGDRHQRQLADLRPGDVGSPDAHHHRCRRDSGSDVRYPTIAQRDCRRHGRVPSCLTGVDPSAC